MILVQLQIGRLNEAVGYYMVQLNHSLVSNRVLGR